MLTGALLMSGCSAEVSNISTSAAGGLASTTNTSTSAVSSLVSTSLAEPPEVQRFIAALRTVNEDALQVVEPGSAVELFTRSLLGISKGRSITSLESTEVNGGFLVAGVLLADFHVDANGKIDTFNRDHTPIEKAYIAGDGTNYGSSDGLLSVSVLAFRVGDRNSPGNSSVVLTEKNSGATSEQVMLAKHTVGGTDYPNTTNTPTVLDAGTELVEPWALGSAPRGGKVTFSLTTAAGETQVTIPMPTY